MNTTVKNKERIEHLKKASLQVRKESMRINKEFSRIEYDPKDHVVQNLVNVRRY